MAVQESSVSVSNSTVSRLGETIVASIESAARLQLVQTLLKLTDRFLWIVEKSAEWSLPVQEITTETNGKTFGKMELVRPLPWIFFLPSLIILRAIRMGLNVGAFVLGYPTVQPSGMVKLIQKSRRRLRTIKSNGLRIIRQRKVTAKDRKLSEAKTSLIKSILMTLSTLSCLDSSKRTPSPPPTRIRVRNNPETTPTPEEQSTTESATSPIEHSDAKRKYSEASEDDQTSEVSQDETVWSKLEQLGIDDSLNDQDFNPAECSVTDENTSSSDPEDISLNELHDIKEDQVLAFSHGNVSTEVIKEETEVFHDFVGQQQSVDVDETSVEAKSLQVTQKERVGEEKQFLSPLQSNADGEADFYSPISSKSASPERYVISSSESDSLVAEEATNGHAVDKRSVGGVKGQSKGKRANHGNRKRK
ncbi:uncharacterized protein LOC107273086 isoform X2 [Cephus cinctus]|uniref:Uncharacterized protein LOC107273086 isoform X2 n=1 Tax=Cephus cinctus TaxID=211228 RepID=A0AAJ7CCI7_CEPCN|nr:uncharacterized protein LOC107273086 isoform X2 [Cephus cinctus]